MVSSQSTLSLLSHADLARSRPERWNVAAQRAGVLPLDVLLGLKLAPRGPAYTLVKLLEAMMSPRLPVTLYASQNRWPTPLPFPVERSVVAEAARRLRVPHRLAGEALSRLAEQRLVRHVREGSAGSIVFTWGEVSLDTSRSLAALGQPVVREKFNCAKATAKRILDRAYARYGLASLSITDEMVAKEQAELELAQAIFCPSPMVTQSLLELGIPADRLIETSYGWEPGRLAGTTRALPPVAGPTLLFAGLICVRKGADRLLEAWAAAKITGRLVLVGEMEPLIKERFASILARDDVLHLPYSEDIGALYRSADWFIFPTLEEGGPQVTYEAAGCGVPVIVSPMGAGAFARHGIDGFVVDSDEVAPWADLIRSLPDRATQRDEMAANARRHAQGFTYEEVGRRRRDALLGRFSHD